jgi:hypothetical protein
MYVDCELHIYGLIGLHLKAIIWGGMVSDRNMYPIHRLAIRRFLIRDLRNYDSS